MKKHILWIFMACIGIFISNCGLNSDSNNNTNRNTDIEGLHSVKISTLNDSNAYTSMIINARCANVLPDSSGAKTITWVSNNQQVTSASPTINLVSGKLCAIDLVQYTNDIGVTYYPTGAGLYLTLSLSTSGIATTTPMTSYTDGSLIYYFAAGTPSGAYQITTTYGLDATNVLSSLNTSPMSIFSFTAGAGAPAPVLSNLLIVKTNGTPASSAYLNYTLTGTSTATGTLSCRIIPSTSLATNANDYNAVNNAFLSNLGVGCPLSVINLVAMTGLPPASLNSNLTPYISGASAIEQTIVWANTVSGNESNGYTIMHISPNI